MTDSRFEMILELKTAGLVEELIKHTGMTLKDSLHKVYNSQVYKTLEREETKLWHHSPLLLLDCLSKELETGLAEFPDE